MGTKGKDGTSDPVVSPSGGDGRLLVKDGEAQRPFMRGIMVHSLMERGVSFEEAYRTAEQVRAQVRDRGKVSRQDLAALVAKILGELAIGEDFALRDRVAVLPETVEITTPSRSAPFSKGVLSQSLLAASLSPDDAFEVAREIEQELLRQGDLRVERRNLRRISYELLQRRFGQTTAERYLVWRQYQEPERPVIILMGGTTGAGKTSLALEVARRLGISRVLSTDSIRQIMRLMLSEELMPAIHASSFDAHRHMATSTPAPIEDPELDAFRSQAAMVSVGVRAIIERAIAESASLVLDGVALVPGLLDLEAYADSAHVIELVVATLDEESFEGRFEEREDRQRLRGKHRYVENLEVILKIQNYFLELADHHDVPIVDNVSIDSSAQLVIRHVVETLKKKAEFKLDESL